MGLCLPRSVSTYQAVSTRSHDQWGRCHLGSARQAGYGSFRFFGEADVCQGHGSQIRRIDPAGVIAVAQMVHPLASGRRKITRRCRLTKRLERRHSFLPSVRHARALGRPWPRGASILPRMPKPVWQHVLVEHTTLPATAVRSRTDPSVGARTIPHSSHTHSQPSKSTAPASP